MIRNSERMRVLGATGGVLAPCRSADVPGRLCRLHCAVENHAGEGARVPAVRAGTPALRQVLGVIAFCALAPFGVAAEPGAAFTEAPYLLVRDGRVRGNLFLSTDAGKVESDCAVYLQNWIQKVAGAKPEIVRGDHGSGPGIRLALVPREPGAGFGDGSFRFEVPAYGRLTIAADTPEGLRAGVAFFAEKELGVTFLMPGEFGADWKTLRAVALPDENFRRRPAFAWRAFSGMDTPAERDWAADNGLGKLPAMNHALHEVFDVAAFAENPSMFPTLGGKITGPSGRGGYEPQPNLANPSSAKHAAKRAREFFQKNPDAPAFSLSINDNMTWDESPESKAMLGSGKYFRDRPDYSDYVFGFMNRTARALREAEMKDERLKIKGSVVPATGLPSSTFHLEPPRLLTGYAYYHCENTPSFRVDARVFPILTADRSEWRDPGFATEDAALMTRWAKSGAARFGIYDYYYGMNLAVPRIFFAAEAASIKHAAESGASLFYAELEPDWGFDGPKAWLAAQLMWNPGADARALLDSYYENAYGPAADAMRRFFEIAESRWTNRAQPPRWIRFFREESVAELFPMSVCAEMRRALHTAERSFDGAPRDGRTERRQMRVRMTALSFSKTEAFVAAHEAKRRLEAMPDATDRSGIVRVREAYAVCVDAETRYAEAVRRWNESALNPGGRVDPAIFHRTESTAVAASKCAGVWRELPFDAGKAAISRVAAACLADKPPEGVETIFSESFEADAFRPATPGTWAAAKNVTIPKKPWAVNLFEARRTRFGFSTERASSGEGALVVAGGDMAKLSRNFHISSGDIVATKLRYSGKIIPGEHVGLSIRFMDSKGTTLRDGAATVAMPNEGGRWRELPVFAVAPDGAESAEVVLRVMYQGAEDALWFDDFTVRRCALGEPLE